jgi:glycosyltransferase involved in cell wall biosynthesis
MRIINIIDRFDAVNFGVWNAACAGARQLSENYQITSELWHLQTHYKPYTEPNCLRRIIQGSSLATAKKMILEAKLNPKDDVIVTHGNWRFPTRWGAYFAKLGFCWVFVPHGMLEPWSLSQRFLLKKTYWALVEKKAIQHASKIRAVGKPEYDNLLASFPNSVLIPNAIPILSFDKKNSAIRRVLFLSRLHKKKNIVGLIQAWKASSLMYDPKWQLSIGGPDDGLLATVLTEIGKTGGNILYIGPQFGQMKIETYQRSTFFILPSLSEGFPLSVLDAAQAGLVPLISRESNFPELIDNGLAIETGTSVESIKAALNLIANWKDEEIEACSKKTSSYIVQHYSETVVADLLAQLYRDLLG